jgi:quinolinate synthase
MIDTAKLQHDILKLKKEKNAILLVHNYQIPEIQKLADFLGDSLQLCRQAQQIKNSDLIVFCGVNFMAETAAILNPDKKVVIPSKRARCPMAAMLTLDRLIKTKKQHPNTPVVLYVNTLAESKAEATIVCTSANADKIVRKLDSKKIIFGPDVNLGYYVKNRVPDVEIIMLPDDGYCNVHRFIGDGKGAMELKNKFRNAEMWAHPECEPRFQDLADYVLSTGGMVRRAKESNASVFIVGTEIGLIDRLRSENPEKTFFPAKKYAECAAMKSINLLNLFDSLKEEKFVVTVPDEIASKARTAIEMMLKLS